MIKRRGRRLFLQNAYYNFSKVPNRPYLHFAPIQGAILIEKIEETSITLFYNFSNGLKIEASSILPENFLLEENPLFILSGKNYYKNTLQDLEFSQAEKT